MSLRKRLALLCAGGIALVLIAGSAVTYVLVRDQLRDGVDASLRQQSSGVFVIGSPRQGVRGTAPASRQRIPIAPAQGAGLRLEVPPVEFGTAPLYVELIDENGKVAAPSFDGVRLPVSERARAVARRQHDAYYSDVRVRGGHLRMYVTPVGGGHALLLARSLSEVDRALGRLAWSLGITGLLGIVLAAAAGLAVARGALRPVAKLTATAERITQTRDLGERIDSEGSDELGRLSRTFNAMLDSLDGAIRSQRQLVVDASHELRTPLTSLRTNYDLLRQEATLDARDRARLLRDVGVEIDELTTLMVNLVDLARGSQRELHLTDVQLDEIAEAVVRRARARYPHLTFVLDARPTTVCGDAEELDRAIWNLVENAAKWSNDGGRIELMTADGAVTVQDQGPGVSAADRPFIFERFYRSDTARGLPGSGLGLAIVRQIAESHGGQIELEETSGGGASFRLSLVEVGPKPSPQAPAQMLDGPTRKRPARRRPIDSSTT